MGKYNYELVEYKGSYNEGTPHVVNYHYHVIKLAEGAYWAGHGGGVLKIAPTEGLAFHINPKFGPSTLEDIKELFDEDGNLIAGK